VAPAVAKGVARVVRMADQAGDVHAAGLEIDDEPDKHSGRGRRASGPSTVKKSVAAITPKCALRKVFHGIVLPRLGAGASP
jgi:hypothetical protein